MTKDRLTKDELVEGMTRLYRDAERFYKAQPNGESYELFKAISLQIAPYVLPRLSASSVRQEVMFDKSRQPLTDEERISMLSKIADQLGYTFKPREPSEQPPEQLEDKRPTAEIISHAEAVEKIADAESKGNVMIVSDSNCVTHRTAGAHINTSAGLVEVLPPPLPLPPPAPAWLKEERLADAHIERKIRNAQHASWPQRKRMR